jgi:glycosyltransferase involved in cell wall biosynthesis
MQTRVTIGVCVRNGEDCIEGAMISINDQDFPHELMEVIFVDDGSKDKTLSIIKGYVPTIKMKAKVIHQDWKGLGVARNVVVNDANGQYIIWVDCDMRLSRGFVRKQVEFMDKNQDTGIGKGRYGLYDPTSLVAYLENIGAIVEFLHYEQEKLSKSLGTGGSIYRVEAIRGIGGFDENIKGVGEDMDAEHRTGKAGWLLKITDAEFYEMRRTNWKTLWNEYFWHGCGGQSISNEVRPRYVLYKTFPPAAFFIEFHHSCTAYKLVHRNVVFLLPFHWIFKRIAWCFGYVTSYVKTNLSSLRPSLGNRK